MREHGRYRVERFERVVLSVVQDAWNAETVEGYGRAFRATVRDAAFEEPWALIVDARQWRLATPEVGPVLAELSRWKERHGMTAAAYLNDDSDLKRAFAESEIAAAYLRAEMRIFDAPEPALRWLTGLGFAIPLRLRQRL